MNIFPRLFIFLLVFVLTPSYLNAQRGEVNGIVKDTTSYPRVANATALVISAKDSILQKFTHTQKDGSFKLVGVPYGNYILIISHPNFGDYTEEITLSDSIKIISKDFFLVQKSILINEVLIQRQRDVKINGDTTEFNANNYKLLENASAEDLLKLLPGLKVDKDGKVTAYGEAVNKVYVDGEEFFGEDPTLATKNIRAEMIDKVQVYDKKTDQETITGVDDGEKNTVINLKLKDEFKKGFFGKVYSRAGMPNSFDNGAMINIFNNKQKLSAYVTQSNIGGNSLSWSDRKNYGASANNTVYEDGYMYTYYSSEDDILDGDEGVSNSINGGTNYSNKFMKEKLGLNASYSFNSGNRDILRTTNTRQSINDSVYLKNDSEQYHASLKLHTPSARLVFDLDSNNKLTYSVTAKIKEVKLQGGYYSETLNSQFDSVNNSERSIDQNTQTTNYSQSLLLSHKFRHIGRTLSINASLDINNSAKTKYVNTRQQYYNGGLLSRKDTLNQKNDQDMAAQTTSVKVSYTESLGKKWLLELHYKPTFATSSSAIFSKVKDPIGEYTLSLDTLSNQFEFNSNKHETGFSLRYTNKKLNSSISISDELGEQQRIDLLNSTNNKSLNYNAINPSLQLRYTFPNNMNLHLRYSGNNQQPQINQLQPIKDYSNPLSINIGNPTLIAAYEHRLNVFVHKYSVQHSKYFYANISYNLTQRDFTQKSTFSNEGITRYMTINGDNTSGISVWSTIGRSILKDLLRVSIEYSFYTNNGNNIVNDVKNRSFNAQNSIGCEFEYSIEKVLNVSLKYNLSYGTNKNVGTITTATNITGNSIGTSGKYNFLKHFYFAWDYSYNRNQSNTATAAPYTTHMLEANGGYKLFKNKGELGLVGYNLLNQNNGYNLYQSASTITRSQHNVLGRYFMISFTYNFSNKGGIHKNGDDDDY